MYTMAYIYLHTHIHADSFVVCLLHCAYGLYTFDTNHVCQVFLRSMVWKISEFHIVRFHLGTYLQPRYEAFLNKGVEICRCVLKPQG